MSNYNILKTNIAAQIKQNGAKAITGQILQTHLLSMITSLGAGYQYMGVAALNTNPGTPDYKCFYIATAVGTYSNFGSPALTVAQGEVAIFYYDTAWHKAVTGAASKADVDALIQTLEGEVSALGQKVDENYTEITGEIVTGPWEMGSMAPGSPHISDYAANNRIRMPELVCQVDGDYTITCDAGYEFLIYVVNKITTATWSTNRVVSLVAGDVFRLALRQDPEVDYSSYTQSQIDAVAAAAGLKVSGPGIIPELRRKESEEIALKGVIDLKVMADSAVESGLSVGEYGFNASIKKLIFKNTSGTSIYYDPTFNGLFRYNNLFYFWNGITLTQVYGDNVVVLQSGDESKLTGAGKTFIITAPLTFVGTKIIPQNTILYFAGGSISGAIAGQYTRVAGNLKHIFGADITISADWVIPTISTDMFTDLSGVNSLKNVFALQNADMDNHIIIQKGEYHIQKTMTDEWVYEGILRVISNTRVTILGDIYLDTNNTDWYRMLYAVNSKNIIIDGSGKLIGDKQTSTLSVGEHGHGVAFENCQNVILRGLDISECFGDSVSLGGNGIVVESCTLHDSRRQGITIGKADNIKVFNNRIYNISGTLPSAGIDIEPNANNNAMNVIIFNNEIYHCGNGIDVAGIHENCIVKNVILENNYIHDIDAATGEYHAIAVHDSNSVWILNNTISEFYYIGIRVAEINKECRNVKICGNHITQVAESSFQNPHAVSIHAGRDILFDSNLVELNDRASIIRGLPYAVFSNNVLCAVGVGSIGTSSTPISWCNFYGNRISCDVSKAGNFHLSNSFAKQNFTYTSSQLFIAEDQVSDVSGNIAIPFFSFRQFSTYSSDSTLVPLVIKGNNKISFAPGMVMSSNIYLGYFQNAGNKIPKMRIKVTASHITGSLIYYYINEQNVRSSIILSNSDGVRYIDIPKSNPDSTKTNVGFVLSAQSDPQCSILIEWIPSVFDLYK